MRTPLLYCQNMDLRPNFKGGLLTTRPLPGPFERQNTRLEGYYETGSSNAPATRTDILDILATTDSNESAMNFNPAHPIYEQGRRTPDRLALYADGQELSYVELIARAARLAAALKKNDIGPGSRVGILGSRSLIAIEAVLATLWCGAAYVPLGPRWPEDRLKTVLSLTNLDAMIVDGNGLTVLADTLPTSIKVLILPARESATPLEQIPPDQIITLDTLPETHEVAPPAVMSGEDLAYIIFTSGTTGVPKGVMAPCSSVVSYLSALSSLKSMTPEDRASQFTELSFDPSLGEIFVPLSAGASLHVVPPQNLVSPARFIRDRKLTIWGATPSAIAWMRDTRSLQPGSLTNLRYSSFGGEPFPLSLLKAWQAAAPNSIVDNFYGPTEATVDCSVQRIAPGATPILTPGRDVLAIGTPHPGCELAIFGPNQHQLPAGTTGELAIAGRQLTLGYLNAPALTAERFPTIAGKRWYLTGDLAVQDNNGVFHHLGRVDNQIKIHGYRVELEDIEAHLRAVSGTDQVAVVAWPMENGVAKSIIGFVAGSTLPSAELREALRHHLPAYMVPAVIHEVTALPLNTTGKLDRRALITRLEINKADGNAADQ